MALAGLFARPCAAAWPFTRLVMGEEGVVAAAAAVVVVVVVVVVAVNVVEFNLICT